MTKITKINVWLNHIISLLLIFLIPFTTFNQTPFILWEKSFGNTENDFLYSTVLLPDGNFISIGSTESFGEGLWILKIDENGVLLWNKTYRPLAQTGSQMFLANSDIALSDDRFTIVGEDIDVAIMQFNLEASLLFWEKIYSWDDGRAEPSKIIKTFDGGFLIIGSFQFWSNHPNSQNFIDYWIMKVDANGEEVWQKTLGGTGRDAAQDVIQDNDGNFVICGNSASDDGDVTGHHGSPNFDDFWVIKLDNAGNLVWEKSLGGSSFDQAKAIILSSANSYILTGLSTSNNGDIMVQPQNFGTCWVVELNSEGEILWQNKFGDGSQDCNNILQIDTNEFIITGTKFNVAANHGYDFWVAKTNRHIELWEQAMGGSLIEECSSSLITEDSNIVLTGASSSNNGDVSNHHGFAFRYDGWMVQLEPPPPCYGDYNETLCYGDIITFGGTFFSSFNPSGEVHVGGGNGCDSIVIVNLNFHPEIIVSDTLIQNDNGTSNGSIEVVASGGSGQFTYEWSNGENTQSIFNLPAGSYNLTVEDSNGCTAIFTFEVMMTTGVDEHLSELIEVFPNPFSKRINLSNIPGQAFEIDVYDNTGNLVHTERTIDTGAVLDLSKLESGLYLIKIRINGGKFIMKRVVKV